MEILYKILVVGILASFLFGIILLIGRGIMNLFNIDEHTSEKFDDIYSKITAGLFCFSAFFLMLTFAVLMIDSVRIVSW